MAATVTMATSYTTSGGTTRANSYSAFDARSMENFSILLAFYARLGFEPYRITCAVLLCDGTPVDRVSKRYFLRI